MGIDISQWRAVIGRNKPTKPKQMRRSKQYEHMREKEAAQDAIWNESMHFWKTAIILVALLFGIWFFLAHTLPGGGRLMGRSCEVTTFGLFLFGEGDFKFLGVGSAEVGGGDGEEVEGRGHEGGAEYLPPRRLFFLISS